MGDRDSWWRVYGEAQGNSKWKCVDCGKVCDARGKGFERHLAVHGRQAEPEVKGEPTEVDVEEEKLKVAGLGMTREEYKGWLLAQMKDAGMQGPARIAAAKVYGETEGYLGDVPEKDMEEKEMVWRKMHGEALRAMGDVRAMILHELRNPVVRGEMERLLEEAGK